MKTHRWFEKKCLAGRQQKWQIETRKKVFDVEKRVDGGNPVVRQFENDKRPGFMSAFWIHAVLAEGGGTRGLSRQQARSAAPRTETEHPELPGKVHRGQVNDANQRAFYRRWSQLLRAATWDDLEEQR